MAFIASSANTDIEFVIKPVREHSIASSRAQILDEIRSRIKEYGDFCHVRRINDGYTITYNQDQGYLLAESIARYFDYPENLVWCEQINNISEDQTRVVIVVIRNHRIMLDTEMLASAVADDIAISIGDGDEVFDIYTHGDVPIKHSPETADSHDIVIEPSRTANFVTLTHSILDLIVPNSSDYLSPATKAVSNAGFVSHTWKYTLGLALLSAVGYWLFIYTPLERQIISVDNYKSYRMALQSIAPSHSLLLLANDYSRLLHLSRWELAQMNIADGNSVGFILRSSEPDYQQAADFAKVFDSTFTVRQRDVLLTKTRSDRLTRAKLDKMVSIDDLSIRLLDELSLNPHLTASLGEIRRIGQHQKRTLNLQVHDISYADLIWLAKILDGRPINLDIASFSVNGFTFSGQINLTLLGY